jgi:S-adenosylhomocysteine hydrolase
MHVLPLAPDPNGANAEQLLKGETAIVTGVGRGIGRAIALELSKVGAILALADVNRVKCASSISFAVRWRL